MNEFILDDLLAMPEPAAPPPPEAAAGNEFVLDDLLATSGEAGGMQPIDVRPIVRRGTPTRGFEDQRPPDAEVSPKDDEGGVVGMAGRVAGAVPRTTSNMIDEAIIGTMSLGKQLANVVFPGKYQEYEDRKVFGLDSLPGTMSNPLNVADMVIENRRASIEHTNWAFPNQGTTPERVAEGLTSVGVLAATGGTGAGMTGVLVGNSLVAQGAGYEAGLQLFSGDEEKAKEFANAQTSISTISLAALGPFLSKLSQPVAKKTAAMLASDMLTNAALFGGTDAAASVATGITIRQKLNPEENLQDSALTVLKDPETFSGLKSGVIVGAILGGFSGLTRRRLSVEEWLVKHHKELAEKDVLTPKDLKDAPPELLPWRHKEGERKALLSELKAKSTDEILAEVDRKGNLYAPEPKPPTAPAQEGQPEEPGPGAVPPQVAKTGIEPAALPMWQAEAERLFVESPNHAERIARRKRPSRKDFERLPEEFVGLRKLRSNERAEVATYLAEKVKAPHVDEGKRGAEPIPPDREIQAAEERPLPVAEEKASTPPPATSQATQEAGAAPEQAGTQEPATPPAPGVSPETKAAPQPGVDPYPLPTGGKNAVTDAERVALELPPREKPEVYSHNSALEEARLAIEATPEIPKRLIAELESNPRPPRDTEWPILIQHKVELINQKNRIFRDMETARKAGEDLAALSREAEDVDAALGQLRTLSETLGTESARSLEFRKIMANEDFSLAAVEEGLVAANKGEALTTKQKAVAESVAKDMAEIQGEKAVVEEATETRMGEQLVADFVKEAKAPPKPEKEGKVAPKAEAKRNEGFDKALAYLDKRADAAAKRIREKMTRLAANPVDLTADLAEWIAAKLARGSVSLAKATTEAVGEFGEKVRPFMEGAYARAQGLADKGVNKLVKTKKSREEGRARAAESAEKADADMEAVLEKIDAKSRNNQGDKISPQVQELARQLIREGVKEHGPLVKRLQKMLDPFFPGITERETNRALVEYGKYKQATKDEVELTLRDVKGQGRNIEHLDRIREGKAPLKKGQGQPPMSGKERRLRKQVAQELKAAGIPTESKAQLRTAEQATEARLRNNLEDIWQWILEGKKRPQKEGKSNERIDRLRGIYSEAKGIYDELFPKEPAKRQPLTPEQRNQMSIRGMELARQAKLERIKAFEETGNVEALSPKKGEKSPPATPEAAALRAELDAIDSTINVLKLIGRQEKSRELSHEKRLELALRVAEKSQKKWDVIQDEIETAIFEGDSAYLPRRAAERKAARDDKEANKPTSPELKRKKDRVEITKDTVSELLKILDEKSSSQVANGLFQQQKTRRIAEMERRMADGDFATKPKKEFKKSPESLALELREQKVREKYEHEKFEAKLKQRELPRKIWDFGAETMHTFRALMTSFDLSAVGRQGIVLALGHPVKATVAVGRMLKALLSEKKRFEIEQKIKGRASYAFAKQSKLFLAEHGDVISRMEEIYMSRWIDKLAALPKRYVVGIPFKGVTASQRGYTTFLNSLRMDVFDAMTATLARDGKPTLVEGKAIANFINAASGRGSLGVFEQAGTTLNTVFFAPRYVASRFNLLALQPFYRGTLRTRRLIAQEYARTLIGAGTVYALALAAGAEIEKDPRAAAYGKIKIGSTTIDPMGGLLQVTVLGVRVTTGETKNQAGEIVNIRRRSEEDKVQFGVDNTGDVLFRFMRTKLSPQFSAAVDIAAGQNVVGDYVSPESALGQMVTPINVRDIYKALKAEGIPTGIALGIVGTFGFSLQTYEERKKQGKKAQSFQRLGPEK